MTSYKRFGNRWTVNECLQLQREFELLQLPIDEIAKLHQRTPNAIMFKLDQECLADYNVLYSNYNQLNSEMSTQRHFDYDGSDEEQDSDDSSDYDEQDFAEDNVSDEDVGELDDDDNESYDVYDLKSHVLRLEKQVKSLTELILKQSYNKSGFSLFA